MACPRVGKVHSFAPMLPFYFVLSKGLLHLFCFGGKKFKQFRSHSSTKSFLSAISRLHDIFFSRECRQTKTAQMYYKDFSHDIVTCIEIRLCIPNKCIGVIIASTSHFNTYSISTFYTIQFKKKLQCLSIEW